MGREGQVCVARVHRVTKSQIQLKCLSKHARMFPSNGNIPFGERFFFFFHHNCMLNFVKCFFCIS